MDRFIYTFICLACVGHGRRVQTLAQRVEGRKFAESSAPSKAVDLASSSQTDGAAVQSTGQVRAKAAPAEKKALSKLLLDLNSAAAFNPAGPGARAPKGKPGFANSRPAVLKRGNRLGQPTSLVSEPVKVEPLSDETVSVGSSSETERATEALEKEVLELRQRVLGSDRPDTLRATTQHAEARPANHATSSYLDMLKDAHSAEADEDISLMKQVFDRQHQILGLDNPDTIRSFYNYAHTVGKCGRHAEAEKLKKQVLDLSRMINGPEHKMTIKAMSSYADTLSELGRHEEAEPLKTQVLELSRRILGPEDTINALNGYADSLGKLGRQTEAEPLRKEAFELAREKLGEDHPDTVKSLKRYAGTLTELGRHAEAEPLKKQVLERARESFDSVETVEALQDYAEALSALGRHAEAGELENEAHQLAQKEFSWQDSGMFGDSLAFGDSLEEPWSPIPFEEEDPVHSMSSKDMILEAIGK